MQKMMDFQISANIDDFFIMIIQNFAKINDFSSYGKNDDFSKGSRKLKN